MTIYKYDTSGYLVSYNANFNELSPNSKIYINTSNEYYILLNKMYNLKEIKYQDIGQYKTIVVQEL